MPNLLLGGQFKYCFWNQVFNKVIVFRRILSAFPVKCSVTWCYKDLSLLLLDCRQPKCFVS